jgi:ABC-2 type transport system permease protein
VARILLWEFGKLIRLRSVQIGLVAAGLLPFLWAIAPGLREAYDLKQVLSAWQLPAFSLRTGMDFLFPFLTALAAGEVLGYEASIGTLKSLLLRPNPRWRILLAKLIMVLLIPILLVLASLLGSLMTGIPYGFGSFTGGTGLVGYDPSTAFVGSGYLSVGQAVAEVLRAHLLAAIILWPIAVLSLLYCVVFLSTTSAALAALSTFLLMRLLVAFPALQPFLLTTYLGIYLDPSKVQVGLMLLLIYVIGFAGLAMLSFERKDV